MPSDLELGRVANNVQELLYTASDVSHDRCVKVLMARAKVRSIGHVLFAQTQRLGKNGLFCITSAEFQHAHMNP